MKHTISYLTEEMNEPRILVFDSLSKAESAFQRLFENSKVISIVAGIIES